MARIDQVIAMNVWNLDGSTMARTIQITARAAHAHASQGRGLPTIRSRTLRRFISVMHATLCDGFQLLWRCPIDDRQQGACAWNDDSMTSRNEGSQKRAEQLVVAIEDSPEARFIAAGIWARATAVRDQLLDAAAAQDKLAGIEAA